MQYTDRLTPSDSHRAYSSLDKDTTTKAFYNIVTLQDQFRCWTVSNSLGQFDVRRLTRSLKYSSHSAQGEGIEDQFQIELALPINTFDSLPQYQTVVYSSLYREVIRFAQKVRS
jgi:hypothetical protein